MPIAMHEEMHQDAVPQTLHVLLPKMLFEVPVRSSRLLWKQKCVPLLQQLEDQAWRSQMPLDHHFFSLFSLLLSIFYFMAPLGFPI